MSKDLNIKKSQQLYNIDIWSEGYFQINSGGDIIAQLEDSNLHNTSVVIKDLVDECLKKGLSLPLQIRFNDILRARVKKLINAFNNTIEKEHYDGKYYPVYPIKVNQQRKVIEQLMLTDDRLGLEAGSKPELLAILALTSKKKSLIICNGYKDREFIKLAILAKKFGHNVFVIIEKLGELDLVLEEAKNMQEMPSIGIRVRLSSMGAGKWQNTGGEKSKFGLSAAELMLALEKLREHNVENSLQLLHSHLGSQIASIRDIQKGVNEAVRYYVEIKKAGFALNYLDVGGGLGVDYEGARSLSSCSITYNLEEYAHVIIKSVSEACSAEGLDNPHIITESGRAMTAHHSVLITDIITKESVKTTSTEQPEPTAHTILQSLWQDSLQLSSSTVVEIYNDANLKLEEAKVLFSQGVISLSERAQVEELYYAICTRVQGLLDLNFKFHRDILDKLNEKLAEKYFCNFSVFQSLPDIWAIEQIFPVLPLSKLNEPHDTRAVLQDLTCDSDGKISYYSYGNSIENSLPTPVYDSKDPYLIGVFMIGAYQEILGDMHNLFGDPDSATVELDMSGSYKIIDVCKGNQIKDVLAVVDFDQEYLSKAYSNYFEERNANLKECKKYQSFLMDSLNSHTYLQDK